VRIGANQILLPPEGKTFFSSGNSLKIFATTDCPNIKFDRAYQKKCKYIIWALAVLYD
jgi:hypothetical protein